MIELVIIACLTAEPQRCDSFHVPFQQQYTVVQCMFQGQLQVMAWAEEHPSWQIKRWNCGYPEA